VADLADHQFRPGRIRHAAAFSDAAADSAGAPFCRWRILIYPALDAALGLGFKMNAGHPTFVTSVLPLAIAPMALAIGIKEKR